MDASSRVSSPMQPTRRKQQLPDHQPNLILARQSAVEGIRTERRDRRTRAVCLPRKNSLFDRGRVVGRARVRSSLLTSRGSHDQAQGERSAISTLASSTAASTDSSKRGTDRTSRVHKIRHL